LRVQGNPFTESGNHRVRILGQFGGRAGEASCHTKPLQNTFRNFDPFHESLSCKILSIFRFIQLYVVDSMGRRHN